MKKVFQDLGFDLPIPINPVQHVTDEPKPITSYHIRPSSWVQFWMDTEPGVLGGSENFEAFWILGFAK